MSAQIDPQKATWSDEYPFESRWLDLSSGQRMHYIDEGPRDAPVLFMIHGNPTWSFYYRNLIRAFSETYRCVVPDHIGCGLSDKPQDYAYTLAQRITDVSELADELGIDDVTMVVHDWGGAIGMGWAGQNADRVRRLVVFNTAAFRSDFIPFSIDICRIPLFGEVAVRGFNGFVLAAQVRAIADRKRLAGVRDAYVGPYDSWANRVAIHEFVKDIPMRPDHPSYDTLVGVEDGLEQFVDHPVLIVWGEQDFCFNPDFRKEWERRFPNAESHPVDDASHFIVEDKTDDVVAWMKDFFERHPV